MGRGADAPLPWLTVQKKPMSNRVKGYDLMNWSFQLYLLLKVPIPTSLFTLSSLFMFSGKIIFCEIFPSQQLTFKKGNFPKHQGL